ncbi:MAG: ABC transporter ATP-binding protein, partial [Pseudomonadales bacterium]|nr:ABC transporter ATP-binding protein [Pseudomonadales bacterium]
MTAALDIKGLRKIYAGGFEALKGIDLHVDRGDFFALLGPNGAGKSTIIGILTSLVSKSAGSVSIMGHDIDKDFSAAKQCLGMVPQEFNFNQFEKVFDIVVTQGGYYGLPKKLSCERAEKYLRKLDLWDKKDVVSRNLSGGMKRRLMIARALVHEPELLVLDEPTAGVDIELRRSMWDFLTEVNEQGTTIILTTHYLEEAESLCRNIGIIDEGEIIECTSMKALLRKLTREVFLFDTRSTLKEAMSLGEFATRVVDEHTLEVAVDKTQSLNTVFDLLDNEGIEVTSMRNKSNRLEEMFVNLLNAQDEKNGALANTGDSEKAGKT